MPPEDQCPHSAIPIVIRHTSSTEGQHRQNISSNKNTLGRRKKMKFNARKLIPMLVLILASFSLLRLVRIVLTTTTSQLKQTPTVENVNTIKSSTSSSLTAKEFHFLSKIVKQRAPCNLLIFGLEPQYLTLQLLNAGGTTTILEDNLSKIRAMQLNNTKVYKVEYDVPTNQAYALLKHARTSLDCVPNLRQLSTCQLALKSMPSEAYHSKWDIVVVDGPAGDSPDAPGRMAAIYMASLIARASGNSTDVVVHDVDRTVEKWFSWEFLCEENLVNSKGKFWHFNVTGKSNSTRFCNPRTVQVQ